MICRAAAEIPSVTAKKVFDVSGLFVAPSGLNAVEYGQ